MQDKSKINIFWFRRDLRLDDNHGLFEALRAGLPVLPVFIFDPAILLKLADRRDRRVNFIHQNLVLLENQLAQQGSSLRVLHAHPLEAFASLSQEYTIDSVFTNEDYEPYAIQRDEAVEGQLAAKGISLKMFKDQVVFAKHDVLKSDGSPYTVFTPYSRQWKLKLAVDGIPHYPSEQLIDRFHRTESFPIPDLPSLGFDAVPLETIPKTPDPQLIQHYHDTRNLPAANGTSRLSVHLRFGSVSVRRLVKIALETNEQWLNELIWREFFMMILFHYPKVVGACFKSKYDKIPWRNNEEEFARWCKGETGYPIVDAGMRELNETGFMHNRVRMIVASFLTKHLLIDWRWGEAYFAEKLLDFDLSANNGNWQWAAGSGCDAAPYFRVFNPTEQTKKFDAQLVYIRRWVKNLDDDYPAPMVQHEMARKRFLDVFKKALNETV